jgi:hypothetical protein
MIAFIFTSPSRSLSIIRCHFQAAMHNPNVSAEAKEHSRQVVEEIQGSDVVHDDGTTEPSSRSHAGDKDENRVLGGYKATLRSQFPFFLQPAR